MTMSTLHSARDFERAALEEIQQSLQAHRALEQAVMAQIEAVWAPAAAEAAAAGMDLESYVAALSADEQDDAYAQAEAEANAAGMDLHTYASALAEAEAAACAGQNPGAEQHPDAQSLEAHALAEQEAAAAGMDLATYVAVLAEAEAAETAHLQAQGGEVDAATAYAMAEEEAAQAGMDLPTYVAALQQAGVGTSSDEQSVLEALAYQEGLALHQAELQAQQVALAEVHGLTPYEVAILQHHHLAQQEALGLLRW